jgi:hypothetical protein
MTDEELDAHIREEAKVVGLIEMGGSGKGKTKH